ncbi:hypothetical protein IP83_18075 [Novosphingobium sp. AAP93]|nr:hypothetical protein IP83_18075 [Novosphingobium sp. AAP93]
MVGWPYDTGAARAKAAIAFVRSGPASAIGYARRAILSDPISAQAVSILGRAELFSQHQLEARKAFQVSGQLGWRDAMTQIYWLDQALQDENYRVAAERLDALLRQTPDDENRDRFLAAVAATPEGRAALAERLKLAPPWALPMAYDLRDLPTDALLQRVDLMRRTGKGVWECAASEVLAQKLITQNLLDDAQSVWALNCGSAGSLVYDGGFEKFDMLKPATGFAWQISDRGDVEIAVLKNATGGQSLSLSNRSTRTLPILNQLVVLKPGRYRLVWRTPETPLTEARQILTSLNCTFDLSDAVEGNAVAGKQNTWSRDVIVDRQCPARRLTFWLPPRAEAHLDNVELLTEY